MPRRDDERLQIAKNLALLLRGKLSDEWQPYKLTFQAKLDGEDVIIEDMSLQEAPSE